MTAASPDLASSLAQVVAEYRSPAGRAQLHDRLLALARRATPDALVLVAEPYRDEPEIIAPLYEVIVDAQPTNARALVILANALWLLGAGPDAVGDLANRAIAADPPNRGAWHLWALSESDPRQRVARWRQVHARFPEDQLALANVADNAAAVAGAEHDYEMLDLAVGAYEQLLAQATVPAQRDAVETALGALKGWKF
jgi:hypothetical protein